MNNNIAFNATVTSENKETGLNIREGRWNGMAFPGMTQIFQTLRTYVRKKEQFIGIWALLFSI